MDDRKKAAFVKANRQKFAKGGLIRRLGNRKYFDDGGTVLGGPSNGGVSENATNPNTGFLGSINGALGLNDNFQAGAADIQAGTNAAQLNDAYTSSQGALAKQQGLVDTLTPGVASGVKSQNALAGQLYGMTQGQGPNPAQMQLAQNTAQNVAQTGAQLAGARGASGNVGLMARQIGQQGAATQQQAAGQAATLGAQQQIAAQQNLANLANNQISQAGQATTGLNSAQQNEQAILQNANTSYNNAAVGMQSNINNVNSQTAAANQNMAANTFGGLMSGASSAMSMLAKGGEVHHKLAEMNAQSLMHMNRYDEGGEVDEPNLGSFKSSEDSASSPNIGSTASLPADTTNFSQSVGGGGGGGGGGGLSSITGLAALLADGGVIQANPLLGQTQINGTGTWAAGSFNPGSSSGGPNIGSTSALSKNSTDFAKTTKDALEKKSDKPQPSKEQTDEEALAGYGQAQSMFGSAPEQDVGATNNDMNVYASTGGQICPGPHKSHVANYLASGGPVPAMVSPGEIYLSPDKVHKVIHEGANPLKIGHKIPGQAKVKGDSIKNDTVPADLEEGGVVIDRKNVMNPEKAALFVHRAVARKKAGGK